MVTGHQCLDAMFGHVTDMTGYQKNTTRNSERFASLKKDHISYEWTTLSRSVDGPITAVTPSHHAQQETMGDQHDGSIFQNTHDAQALWATDSLTYKAQNCIINLMPME